jgi:hypothetical protein
MNNKPKNHYKIMKSRILNRIIDHIKAVFYKKYILFNNYYYNKNKI